MSTKKKNEDTKEKKKLLQDIQELKDIIKQCEWSLDTLHFKDVEKRVIKSQSSFTFPRSSKIPNVEVDLQYDLYKFAGLHCVKSRKEEVIFNFTSINKQEENNTYALQIFVKDEKGDLGKWVMPMSIDMNYMLTKTPIHELKNLNSFIKGCKHNINCYNERQQQFLSLKEDISHIKYCTLQSNMGYTQFILELYSVHDNKNDKYINLIIYLLYHSEQARPYKIEMDTIDNDNLDSDIKKRLKVWLKEFKVLDLQTAFDKVLTENNSVFEWMKINDSDSPLELNDISNSSGNEDFLEQFISNRKKSLRTSTRKHKLQKKRKKMKRRREDTSRDIAEHNRKNSDSGEKTSPNENPRKILRKRKALSTFKQQDNVNKNLSEETTPLNKSKVRLKQTKLNFQTNQDTSSKEDEIPSNKRLKALQLITSTPLIKNVNTSLSASLDIDITNIEILKKTANKLSDLKNISPIRNKTRKRRI